MTDLEQCRECTHGKKTLSYGLLCALTDSKPDFDGICPDFYEKSSFVPLSNSDKSEFQYVKHTDKIDENLTMGDIQQDLRAEKFDLKPAPSGKRFGNYLLDIFFFYIFIFLFFGGITMIWILVSEDIPYWLENIDPITDRIITTFMLIVYYTVFETVFGQTLGKMITGTMVVMSDGSKPPFGKILGRSFSRLIPFDAFSFFGKSPVGWHDSIPGTMVVFKSDWQKIQNYKNQISD